MKALVKYIVYPPLSIHFYDPYKYIIKNVKNIYCNIWIRKNF